MRNIAVSLFMLCVGSIIVGGCGPSKEEIQKQAVQEVMNQINGGWNLHEWQIDKIDLRACPPDFQETVLIWKGTAHIPYEKSSWFDTPEITAARAEREEKYRQEHEKEKRAAWIKVETVALRYGAQTGM